MGDLNQIPWWGPVLVTIAPAVILSRMVWVYAVKKWLDNIVPRQEMEQRFAEERLEVEQRFAKERADTISLVNEHRRATVELVRSMTLKRRNP